MRRLLPLLLITSLFLPAQAGMIIRGSGGGGGAPAAYVQSDGNNVLTSDSSIAVSLTGVTAGNLIVVLVQWRTDAATVTSVSDGTSSLTPGTEYNQNEYTIQFFYLLNANGGSITYTANFSVAAAYKTIQVIEFSGGPFVFDAENGKENIPFGASFNSNTISTASANEVVVGGLLAGIYVTMSSLSINGESPDGGTATNPEWRTWCWYYLPGELLSGDEFSGTASASITSVANIISFKEGP